MDHFLFSFISQKIKNIKKTPKIIPKKKGCVWNEGSGGMEIRRKCCLGAVAFHRLK